MRLSCNRRCKREDKASTWQGGYCLQIHFLNLYGSVLRFGCLCFSAPIPTHTLLETQNPSAKWLWSLTQWGDLEGLKASLITLTTKSQNRAICINTKARKDILHGILWNRSTNFCFIFFIWPFYFLILAVLLKLINDSFFNNPTRIIVIERTAYLWLRNGIQA